MTIYKVNYIKDYKNTVIAYETPQKKKKCNISQVKNLKFWRILWIFTSKNLHADTNFAAGAPVKVIQDVKME